MATPKVSIIIPVYNTEKYLQRCMDSILGQTLEDIEVILVDDESKAECAAFCDKFANEDSRVQVIHKKNGGAGFARNSGLAVARGEYVGFVDSDDYAKPTMFAELYEAAIKHDADLVMSGVCYVGGTMFNQADGYVEDTIFQAETVFEQEETKNLILGVVGALPHERTDSRYGTGLWKNLFKRSIIEENQLQFVSEREFLSEDTLFIIDFLKLAKRAVGLPKAYYCYCRNGDSISKAYKRDRMDKCVVFLQTVEARISDVLRKEEYGLYLDRLAQGYCRVICMQEIVHAREEKTPYSALRSRLHTVCTQKAFADVLKTYPYHKLPKKQAVFAFAMRYKLFALQKLFVALREK